MIHVVSVSGGLSSMAAYWHIYSNFPNVNAVFCDTVIENEDLYRFLLEVIAKTNGVKFDTSTLRIPPVSLIEFRKQRLLKLKKVSQTLLNNFTWLTLNKTPFDIFQEHKYMGNSRVDLCSKHLKREIFRKYLSTNYHPHKTTVYLGLDHDEPVRIARARESFRPYIVEFPIASEPWLIGNFREWLCEQSIEIPQLYKLGFAHNNCGGFCVKAGLKQFKQLQEKLPETYDTFASFESATYKVIGKKHPFLKITRMGVTKYLTMGEFKTLNKDIPNDDEDNSCSCFL
jgi:hypothetical protein